MCGLAGFIDLQHRMAAAELARAAQRMADRMVPRGPDDAGAWSDAECAIAMGFRRLAILDLSADGHQPMRSRSGRYVITFNGEIYNHAEIRAELEDLDRQAWRGHSDTEVLLEAIDRFGFTRTLEKLNGMFAIAVWNSRDKSLLLARDRFGEKPLYYGKVGETFMFASDLKALQAHPSWHGEIDWQSMSLFLRYAYIPGPHSAYRKIAKLPPGTWLKISKGGAHGEPTPYWSAGEKALYGAKHPFDGSYEDASYELERLILDAVDMRIYADVPVGAFLSGGIDSSTVVAAMQKQSARPVRTYSISFADQAYNEAPFAAAVAEHIGSKHTELEVSEAACLDVLAQLQDIYDEPFADASQIPTTVLSQLTRQHVTVALSGDGGDELFCGYNRYRLAPRLWDRINRVPAPIRAVMQLMQKPVTGRSGSVARRLGKILNKWSPATVEEFYREYVSWWASRDGITPGHPGHETLFERSDEVSRVDPLSLRLSLIDTLTYLPDDLLVKVDRASMSASLEVRAPLLDHRVAEFAWTLPEHMKIDHGTGKSILREVLYRHVPRELVDRPKQGFEPPIGRWLREGLRDWANDLLAPARLQGQGFLNHKVIAERWSEHASGRRNWAHPIWNVLMLQAWLEAQS